VKNLETEFIDIQQEIANSYGFSGPPTGGKTDVKALSDTDIDSIVGNLLN
jgi:hypothetical protein